MPGIVVIGSVNMDLVVRTSRIPQPGETVLGSDGLMTIPGGKGANQAVAAARLDGATHLVGRVGEDEFAERLIAGLEENNVRCDHVQRTPNTASGCATILVDDTGENSIVVAPGANAKLTPDDIDAAEDLIAHASVVMLQLEVPYRTVRRAIEIARKHGVFVILDPAPAPEELPRYMYNVDLLVPNQTEAQRLLGQGEKTKKRKAFDPKVDAADLIARGPKSVVLKMGSDGCLVVTADGAIEKVRTFKTKVVDTTAAGDAFVAGLAVAYMEGAELREAARFGNAAGAIACSKFGAQTSLPKRRDVDRLMKRA